MASNAGFMKKFKAAPGNFTVKRAEFHAYQYLVRSQEAREWIDAVLGTTLDADTDLPLLLQDGQVLCNLANAIQPGAVHGVSKLNDNFHHADNVNKFVAFCKSYGLLEQEVFEPTAFCQGTDMVSVVNTVHTLGTRAPSKGFTGPALKPTDAVDFTRAQIDIATAHINAASAKATNHGGSSGGFSTSANSDTSSASAVPAAAVAHVAAVIEEGDEEEAPATTSSASVESAGAGSSSATTAPAPTSAAAAAAPAAATVEEDEDHVLVEVATKNGAVTYIVMPLWQLQKQHMEHKLKGARRF